MVLLAVCSANAVAFLQRHANQADDTTGAEAHADERPPSNDAPTSRSLMFATMPQKMTYSSSVGSVTCASYAYTVMAGTKADTASSTAIEVGSSFRYYYNTLADCDSMCTLWSGWSGGDECVGFVDYRDKETPYCVLVSSYTTVAGAERAPGAVPKG